MQKILFCVLTLSALFWWVGRAYSQEGEVLVLEAEGLVTPAMASYFERGIEAAEDTGAMAVLIILDTPGGDLDTTKEILQAFRGATVPIIVYVSPIGAQAASAGSLITIAAHVAAMAPETVIGAASPVGEGGAELDETIFRKLTEDLKAQIRSMVDRRGPEARALAEAMIEEARAVNASEALEVGLIDVVAVDVPDLMSQLDGFNARVGERTIVLETAGANRRIFSMSLVEQVLHALSNPLFVSILLVIGVQAILIEMSSPGGWVAGFIGVLSLGLAFYGLGQLPANWLGLGLIAVAFVLFALEVKAPTHGALAIAGTATLVVGLLILFNSPGTPQFARISIPAAISVAVFTAAFFVFLATTALRAQRAQPATGKEGLVGKLGQVRRTFESKDGAPPYTGMVLVAGELWRARADEPLANGDGAKIVAIEGFTLTVERADS